MPSRAILATRYDAKRTELTLSFANGRTYVYSLVPPAVFAALEAAASKGAFVNAHIRDRYPYRRLQAGSPAASLRDALKASTEN